MEDHGSAKLKLDGPTAAKLEKMLRDALIGSGAYINIGALPGGKEPNADVRFDSETLAKLEGQLFDALKSAYVIDPAAPSIRKKQG
jgi:hypothetical protein